MSGVYDTRRLVRAVSEAAHTVGQSATQSTKWMQQKTRRTLNFNPLLEALKAGPAKPFAKLLEKQDGGCGFFYNGIKHKDKSLTNERVMLRLTQTPKKIPHRVQHRDEGSVCLRL